MPSAATLRPAGSLRSVFSAPRRRRSPRIAVLGPPSLRDPLNLQLPLFDGELEEAIAGGATHLIVDLRGADPVGSLALNALLRARLRLGKDRVALVISPRLRHFCESTALDRRFLLADDLREALRLVQTRAMGRSGGTPYLGRGGKRAA